VAAAARALLEFEPGHGVLVLVVVEVADAADLLVGQPVGEYECGVVDGAEVARQYLEGVEMHQGLHALDLVRLELVLHVAELVQGRDLGFIHAARGHVRSIEGL